MSAAALLRELDEGALVQVAPESLDQVVSTLGSLLAAPGAAETLSDPSTGSGALLAALCLLETVRDSLARGPVVLTTASGDAAARARVEELIRVLTPDVPLPSPAGLLLARRNAEARLELLRELPALTAAEVGRARPAARNPYALAGRWRDEGRIFAVTHAGRTLYPLFQLAEDGEPLPAVRTVLAALPRERMSEWEQALWWTSGNGHLGGARPVDLLGPEPGRVVAAARALGEPAPL